jgi:uncharacterized protein YgiM (DUF1202 family)
MKRLTRMICIALAIFLFVGTTTLGVSAKSGTLTTHVGTVEASALRLRSGPSTSTATLAYASRGEYVTVLGKSGSWYQVNTT